MFVRETLRYCGRLLKISGYHQIGDNRYKTVEEIVEVLLLDLKISLLEEAVPRP